MLKPFDNSQTWGRRKPEDGDDRPYLTDFQRIIESKAYRRLADKTQAFSIPKHPHVRTRLIHTNEVISASIQLARGLGLNVDLCMAIAAGHDLGHVPFGHVGERAFTELALKKFSHPVYSVVVAQEIENRGKGLNLSYETLEGILKHSSGSGEITFNRSLPEEYSVVKIADKVVYAVGDYSDAANRAGHIPKTAAKLMDEIDRRLGVESVLRRDVCIDAIIAESMRKGRVSFSKGPVYETFDRLRSFLYREVYGKVDDELHRKAIMKLYTFLSESQEFKRRYNHMDPLIFISLLTDTEVTEYGSMLFTTKRITIDDISSFGAFELLPELKDKKIDYADPGLDWGKDRR